MAELIRLGRCTYADPDDDDSLECYRMGRYLTVREPIFGNRIRICRCRDHSDWIEADAEVPA